MLVGVPATARVSISHVPLLPAPSAPPLHAIQVHVPEGVSAAAVATEASAAAPIAMQVVFSPFHYGAEAATLHAAHAAPASSGNMAIGIDVVG